MSLDTKTWTLSDIAATPEDGKRYEIIDGELFVSASPHLRHQVVLGGISDVVRTRVRTQHLGLVLLGPVDVVFSETPVVVPDLFFIREERLGIIRDGKVFGAPDLVVEVLSPSTRRIDLTRKRSLFGAHGVPEYWLVDPFANTLTILALRNGAYEPMEPDDDGRLRSAVLGDLPVDPSVLFAPER